jgi:hypothetical protein
LKSFLSFTEQRIICTTFPAPRSNGCYIINDHTTRRTQRFSMFGNIKWTTKLEVL